MLTFFIANIGPIIVGLVVLFIIAGVVIHMIRNKKKGKSACGCGCSGCDGCPKSKECDETIKKTGN